MKNSFLILGIALVSFANVCNAKSFAGESKSPFQNDLFADANGGKFPTEEVIVENISLNEDTDVVNPEIIIPYKSKTVKEIIIEGDKITENSVSDDFEFIAFEESMKEIIAQSDLIIENTVSNETYPLFNERTPEDEICELEMIIESKENNDLRPLDFKKINNNSVFKELPKRFVGMD
ncbi:hypothetical protein [Flavobacterium gilvum]|uniref:Uncharacterized protein n=1 Tax=Flavobacterium gilvum TaxID=1492737 RepID=A0AAC9N6U0_9FLAO|nr:hypothetical protein [Flavobacterium gilvum]AOW10079.1 hypothetical protein EM308_11475 [Flavobacterium gilvum]KFC57650.1 hypothetical protein FEM08_35720 [Flavobacterium gilvum]